MRTTASVLTIVAVLLGACTALGRDTGRAIQLELDPAGWELWVPVTVLEGYEATGDVSFDLDTTGVDLLYADVEILSTGQGDTVDVFLNGDPAVGNNLVTFCTHWNNAITCSQGYIEETQAATTVRVESNATYRLAIRGFASIPAPYVTFLPEVGR